jgi:hypothetical protein
VKNAALTWDEKVSAQAGAASRAGRTGHAPPPHDFELRKKWVELARPLAAPEAASSPKMSVSSDRDNGSDGPPDLVSDSSDNKSPARGAGPGPGAAADSESDSDSTDSSSSGGSSTAAPTNSTYNTGLGTPQRTGRAAAPPAPDTYPVPVPSIPTRAPPPVPVPPVPGRGAHGALTPEDVARMVDSWVARVESLNLHEVEGVNSTVKDRQPREPSLRLSPLDTRVSRKHRQKERRERRKNQLDRDRINLRPDKSIIVAQVTTDGGQDNQIVAQVTTDGEVLSGATRLEAMLQLHSHSSSSASSSSSSSSSQPFMLHPATPPDVLTAFQQGCAQHQQHLAASRALAAWTQLGAKEDDEEQDHDSQD